VLHYLHTLIGARRREDGASAVEYGLLVAGIAAVSVVIVMVLGGVIKTSFQNSCSRVGTGASSTAVTC
jgi:pilus assembly protein Flp/PilA